MRYMRTDPAQQVHAYDLTRAHDHWDLVTSTETRRRTSFAAGSARAMLTADQARRAYGTVARVRLIGARAWLAAVRSRVGGSGGRRPRLRGRRTSPMLVEDVTEDGGAVGGRATGMPPRHGAAHVASTDSIRDTEPVPPGDGDGDVHRDARRAERRALWDVATAYALLQAGTRRFDRAHGSRRPISPARSPIRSKAPGGGYWGSRPIIRGGDGAGDGDGGGSSRPPTPDSKRWDRPMSPQMWALNRAKPVTPRSRSHRGGGAGGGNSASTSGSHRRRRGGGQGRGGDNPSRPTSAASSASRPDSASSRGRQRRRPGSATSQGGGRPRTAEHSAITVPEEPEGEYYLLHPFLVLQGFVEVDILDFRHEPIARLTYHAGDSCFSRGLLRQNIVKVHEHTELMVGDFGAFQEFAGA